MKKYGKLLLVDDDTTSIFLTQMLIEDIFPGSVEQIQTANNGQEALEILSQYCLSSTGGAENFCPDLILLDINMPVMDGFEFLEQLQKMDNFKKNQTKIVLLTSSTNPKDIERAQKYNVYNYLSKPLTEEKLKTVL
jgi:CheY-like chemotaxis protein